jgi:hypothetical protein
MAASLAFVVPSDNNQLIGKKAVGKDAAAAKAEFYLKLNDFKIPPSLKHIISLSG